MVILILVKINKYKNIVNYINHKIFAIEDKTKKKKYLYYYNNISHINKFKTISMLNEKTRYEIIKNAIPLNIFQTWDNVLPPDMCKITELIQAENPEFKYCFYDTDMCRQFIKDNFIPDILKAYDMLIPLAYKSDLWRYCVLYRYGGIYLDIKFKPTDGFKFSSISDKEYFVMERPSHCLMKNTWGIYNGMIVSKPNNIILLKAINNIVQNTFNNYYGCHQIYPTGPGLLGRIYFNNIDIDTIDMCFNKQNDRDIIIYKNICILESYSTYRQDQKNTDLKTYGKRWVFETVYKV